MIYDVDTRLWASAEQLGPALAASLRERNAARLIAIDANEEAHAAAATPVDRSFVLGFRSELLGADLGNEFIAQVARRQADHLVPFAGIDPMSAGWMEELDRATELGHVGVSVSPSFQGYPPTHSRAMRLWERCAAEGLPVIASRPAPAIGSTLLSLDQPLLWEEPLRDLPELTLVIAGLGAPFVDETLALLEKAPRAFAHVAGLARQPLRAYEILTAAIERGVAQRLLFASGFPAESPTDAIQRFLAVNSVVHTATLPPLPRRQLVSILERDAAEALGIRMSAPTPRSLPADVPELSSAAMVSGETGQAS